MYGIYITTSIQRGIELTAEITNYITPRCGWDIEWCSSFVLVLKTNVKMRLYISVTRPNLGNHQANAWGPNTDFFPKDTYAHYLTFINSSSGYHNLKSDENSLYLTAFAHKMVDAGMQGYH